MSKLKNYDDIVGKQFGKLCVIKCVGAVRDKSGYNRMQYACRCECGNEVTLDRKLLICGNRTTCGSCCRIVEEKDYLRYICANGESFIFDKEDRGLIESRRWYISESGYVKSQDKGIHIRLTHYLLNVPEGYCVDHISGDTLDERKQNLRLASGTENNRNGRIRKTNRSGYKGIHYRADCGKYRAAIWVDKKPVYLGYFDTPEEAASAYDEAARFYYGEFACVNFPREGERGCRPAEVFPMFDVYEDFEDLDAVI